METVQSQRFILPTLQSNFNYAIGEILRRMNNTSIAVTWRAIETLYYILPPKIHEEVKGDYENIIRRVNSMSDPSVVDYPEMAETNRECCVVLEELGIPFFRKMYELLYKGGYLEKKPREIPTNLPMELFQKNE